MNSTGIDARHKANIVKGPLQATNPPARTLLVYVKA